MKNNIIKKLTLSALALLSSVIFASCIDEWTQTESIQIDEPTLEEKNPELYAEYLEMLRQYKKSEHKVVYVSYNNLVKDPVSRAHHIDVIPDSVDYVELIHPDDLVERELEEMDDTRNRKGTKFIYTISYSTLEDEYLLKVVAGKENISESEKFVKPTEEDFLVFINEYTTSKLALAQKYNYDGVILSYMGQGLLNSTEEEKAIYTARQKAFLAPISKWAESNPEKLLSFEGRAYNLINKAILQRCNHIIVPSSYASSASGVEKILRMSLREDIPVEKLMVAVQTPNIDNPNDKTTGYFDGESAILGIGYWMGHLHNDFEVAGMAIYNVNNDFYNINKIYGNTRKAISLIN